MLKSFAFGRIRSFQSRLLLLAILTSAVAALLVCATLVTAQQLRVRTIVAEQLEGQGDVIAFNIAATLSFDRPDEAVEVLTSLQAVDHVVAAHLFDAQGEIFASRRFLDTDSLPAVLPRPRGLEQESGWLIHHTPVSIGEAVLGSLALVYDPSWMTRRMWLNIVVAFLITAFAMFAAVLFAQRLQQALALPIREIIDTSRVVSETGDYSVAAHRFDDDELGELTDAFNAMLQRISRQSAERKRAEEALREREKQLQTLTNAVPAFVWRSDAQGYVTAANDRWYEYTRAERSIPVQRGARAALHPEDYDRVTRLWRNAASTGTPYETELRIRRHDGRYRWFLARALPLRDDSGVVAGWFGTTTDIEDRKRVEAERDELLASERSARTDAERASRLKDEFVATLSHELRTPLAAILGWAHLLQSEKIENQAVREGLDTIERNARAQTQMIDDLLDMSRIVSGKIRLDVQLVDLPEAIDAAIATVRPAAESKGIRLHRIVDPRVGPVQGDSSRLQQIVWNLLSNAVKFTPKGGRIEVTLQRVNSHIELAVSDTGEGIEPDFMPYLFERFRQADASSTRTHSGLGIGLALVKHLAELHGGTVAAYSAGRDRGSTFTVSLPLAIMRLPEGGDRREQPVSGSRRLAIESPDLSGLKIMVVEDEEDARAFIVRLLENAHAAVWAGASATAALDELKRFTPDVVVSDIGMPNMDGYQFMRELRRRTAADGGRVPALALTAFARSEDRTRALIAGYQMHIVKPVEPAELLAAVASLASLKARQERVT